LIKSRGLSAAKRTVNRHHMLAYDPRRGSVAPINTFNFKRKLLGHRPHTHIHMHRGAEQKGGPSMRFFLGWWGWWFWHWRIGKVLRGPVNRGYLH